MSRKSVQRSTRTIKGGFKVTTTKSDKGWSDLMRLLKDMGQAQTRVVAGITGERGEQVHPKGKETIVDIAIRNEFGSPGGKIPERPAIRSTVDANGAKYRAGLRRAFRALIEDAIAHGQVDPKKAKALERLGLQISGDMKRTISAGVPPPNAPSTIAAKGSDTPLIDSGRTRQAITSEVRRGGGE